MPASSLEFTRHFDRVMRTLSTHGALLAAYDSAGRANAMTIGWGTLGVAWGLPLWTVLVRPSRYTYGCIESAGAFSVCVPAPDLKDAAALCGSKSGRDLDKLAACNLAVRRAADVNAPDIVRCPIVYFCQVVHANDVIAPRLSADIQSGFYKSGDYHRVYFGRVVSARFDADAAERLTL